MKTFRSFISLSIHSILVIAFLAACQPKSELSKNGKSMLDFKYPYKTEFLNISDSIQIAYIDEGKGDIPLVFIHGLGSYLPAWKKNIDVLKNDFRCIALDLPGYPKSSKRDYPYTMSFFADSVIRFLEKMKIEKAILVGHSMGGQISMTVGLQRPDLLEKLILVDPAGIEKFSPTEAIWLKTVFTPEVVKSTPTEQIKKNFDVNFAAGITPEDAMFMYEDRLYMRDTEKEYDHYCKMIPKCVAGMLDEPVFDRLNELKTPTLVFFGEQDYLIPNKMLHKTLTVQDVAKSAQQAIPNSILIMVPNAGHFAMWDNPTLINAKIRAFVGE